MDELKNLYRLGFPEDSEGDVEYFFREKIRDAEIFSYSEEGRIISAAYIFRRKLRIFESRFFAEAGGGENSKFCGNFSVAPPLRPSHGGEFVAGNVGFERKDKEGNSKFCGVFKDIEIPFLVAAATLPEFRGKKIFHNVMRDIFSRYESEPFVALYPFKHEYYGKNFGFENFNYLPDFEENIDGFCLRNGDCFKVVDCLPSGENCGRDRDALEFDGEGADNFCSGNSSGGKEILNFRDGKRLSEILTGIYSSYAEGFDAYIVRDGKYFENKIAEWRAGNGKIGLIYSKKSEKDGGTEPNYNERSGKSETAVYGRKNELIYPKKSEKASGGIEPICYERSEKSENAAVCGRKNEAGYNEKLGKNENAEGGNRQEKTPVGYVFFGQNGEIEERCFINPHIEKKFCGENPKMKPAMMIKILNGKKAAELFYPRSFSDLKTFSLEKY